MNLLAVAVFLLALCVNCFQFLDYSDVDTDDSWPEYDEGTYLTLLEPDYWRKVSTDENVVDVDPPAAENDPEINPSSVEKLEKNIDKLLADFGKQHKRITELEEANKKLTLKIDSLEEQIKTNNIILSNVPQNVNENSKTTLQKVLHVLNRIMMVRTSPDDIALALRAESNSSSENKPIVIRFTNFATKMKVLAASNRLSHTNLRVSSDYSELVAKKRAELLPYMQRARAHGYRAFILYDKLIVNGVPRTIEDLIDKEIKNKGSEGAETSQDRDVALCENKDVIYDPKEQVEEVEVDPRFADIEE